MVVSRVREFDLAGMRVQDAVKDRDKHASLILRINQAVYSLQAGAGRHAFDRRGLQKSSAERHKQSRWRAFPRHVCDSEAEPSLIKLPANLEEIIKVPADGARRRHLSEDLDAFVDREFTRPDGLLNARRQIQFLLNGPQLLAQPVTQPFLFQ